MNIPSNWEDKFGCCGVLTVPGSPVLEYYAVAGVGGALAIWKIAISKYVVIAVLPNLLAACHGAVGVTYPHRCNLRLHFSNFILKIALH